MTAIWRQMTDDEKRAALALERVRFPVASPPKRLARSLVAQAKQAAPEITDNQAASMWGIVNRFRRQIAGDIVKLAPAASSSPKAGGEAK